MAEVRFPVDAPAVGIDVASATRLRAALARRPALAQKVFSARERQQSAGRADRLAARWAAKEAARKLAGSLGASPLPAFGDLEVTVDASGAPHLLHRGLETGLALSLSHEGDLAVAVAVALPAAGDRPDAAPLFPPPVNLRLPSRSEDAHKGSFGTVVVLAGAHGYTGAAYLAAMGAARGGAGRVHLCVPAALHPLVAVKCTEVMVHALPDAGAGLVGEAAVTELVDRHLPGATALVAGPGLGRAPATGEALAGLLAQLPCPAVIDADGLTLAARQGVDWRRSGQPVVLTPHPAEMGRLAGQDTSAVQADRRAAAGDYARQRGVVVVLKGARTVVAAPDGRSMVAPYALPALASGGTGDVLAGLCGALVGAGLEAFDAAVAAVCIHGEAGAAVQARRGRAGALASDLLEALPAAQERLRRAVTG